MKRVTVFCGSSLVIDEVYRRQALLLGQILAEQKIALKDLSAIAISAGPGSYTGLRVGMATAKGARAIPTPLTNQIAVQENIIGLKPYYDITLPSCPRTAPKDRRTHGNIGPASSTQTFKPALASTYAAIPPPAPLPTITASYFFADFFIWRLPIGKKVFNRTRHENKT